MKCRLCGKTYPKEALNFCTDDFGPLEVIYDYEEVARTLTRVGDRVPAAVDVALPRAVAARRRADRGPARRLHAAGPGRPAGPGARASPSSTSRTTPSTIPTLSFKDRVVAVALSKAVELGFQTVGCASTGNLANSVAANAAAAGLDAYVLIPDGLEQGKVLGATIYGAKVIAIDGNYDQVNRLCSQIAFRFGWGFVNVNLRPFYAEGSKTVGFEIAEDLGWRTPDHVVVPDGRRQPDRQDLQGVQGVRAASACSTGPSPPGSTAPRRPAATRSRRRSRPVRARSSRSAIRRRSPRASRSATRPTATSPRS